MDLVRENAIKQMIATIGQTQWDKNMQFIALINDKAKNHRIKHHPIISSLDNSLLSTKDLQVIHLEYRIIVHIFTDALLMAQFQALKLDETMKPGIKAYIRFLITLNTLDEFGFGYELGKTTVDFSGSPENSHLILFEDLISQLKISDEEKVNFPASKITAELKETFLASYDDLHLLIIFLALAEEIVMIFSPVMRKSCETVGIPINQGYYNVHGSSVDDINDGSDDFHQNDLWMILAQILGDYDQEKLLQNTDLFLDQWYDFWSQDFSGKAIS